MAITLGRKQRPEPAMPTEDIAARWRAELDEWSAALATGRPEADLEVRDRRAAAALDGRDELRLLEVLAGPIAGPAYPNHITGQAAELLSDPDAGLAPLSDASELQLGRLTGAETVDLLVERRTPLGDRYRDPVTVDVAGRARALLRLCRLFRDRRAEAARQRDETARHARAVDDALARVRAELEQRGTWAALARGDPVTLAWLETDHARRWLMARAPAGGWDVVGVADRLRGMARQS